MESKWSITHDLYFSVLLLLITIHHIFTWLPMLSTQPVEDHLYTTMDHLFYESIKNLKELHNVKLHDQLLVTKL